MITDAEALIKWKQGAMKQAPGKMVLDLEADSLHRHKERLCLIQYADEHSSALIDPLAIEDMRPFSNWLQEAEVWMHGADYDMCLLQAAYNTLPKMIYDTQIAARLLGYLQFGLAALVEQHFGIVLSKKNQKADWGKRPLSEEMQDYAMGDVKYILPMAAMLVENLKAKGRYEWFIESCQYNLDKGRARHGEEEVDPWRIKGSGKLSRRGLAALCSLWNWRNDEAAEWDKPCFMVCSNDELLRWSVALQEFRTATPRRSFHTHRAARFARAVERFQMMDEEDYPKRIRNKRIEQDDQFDARLDSWLSKRNHLSASLGIEGSIIASRQQLEAIAHDREKGLAKLMSWQRELLTS